MRAVTLHGYGDADVLAIDDVPTPEPGPGEVRVKVAAAAVNRTDVNARTGAYGGDAADIRLGMDVSGTVDAVGPDVSSPAVGTPVVGFSMPAAGQAEFVVLPLDGVAPAPSTASLEAAATLPLNGLTAGQALAQAQLPEGAGVLVTGAAGGLGWFLVQLAHLAGHRVTALVKPGTDPGLLTAVGADEVVSTLDEVPEHSLDGVLDAATLVQPTISRIRDGGVYVDFRQSQPELERSIRHAGIWVHADPELLRTLVGQVEAGALQLSGVDVRPLAAVADAQRDFEAGGIRDRLVLVP